jgi:PiT family inorganic phosphate transporter
VIGDPRSEVTDYIRTREFKPATMLGLEQLVNSIAGEAALYKELKSVPANMTPNLRNDMYVASEALRLMKKSGSPQQLSSADWTALENYRKHIDSATKFIPTWVKVAVAIALGLGTMVGWKRIVVTSGKRSASSI